MPLTPTTANTVLTYKGTLCTYLSVHTADPGTTGTAEAAGGSYARQLNAWGTATAGSMSGAPKTFTPGAGTYMWAGYWSAATGGTFIGSFPIPSKSPAAGDTITVTPTLTQTES